MVCDRADHGYYFYERNQAEVWSRGERNQAPGWDRGEGNQALGGTAVCRTKSVVRNEQKQTTSIEGMCILHMIKCENR